MAKKNKAEIPMTPELQRFQYELASEIGISGLGEFPGSKKSERPVPAAFPLPQPAKGAPEA